MLMATLTCSRPLHSLYLVYPDLSSRNAPRRARSILVVEKAAEPTIHAEINGGRRDGEVAGSIQMRFNVREESRKRCQEAEEVAGDVMEEKGGRARGKHGARWPLLECFSIQRRLA